MAVVRLDPDHSDMERGLHHIQDELTDTWLEEWAGAGLADIEAYLAKYAAFLSYLESQESV